MYRQTAWFDVRRSDKCEKARYIKHCMWPATKLFSLLICPNDVVRYDVMQVFAFCRTKHPFIWFYKRVVDMSITNQIEWGYGHLLIDVVSERHTGRTRPLHRQTPQPPGWWSAACHTGTPDRTLALQCQGVRWYHTDNIIQITYHATTMYIWN